MLDNGKKSPMSEGRNFLNSKQQTDINFQGIFKKTLTLKSRVRDDIEGTEGSGQQKSGDSLGIPKTIPENRPHP